MVNRLLQNSQILCIQSFSLAISGERFLPAMQHVTMQLQKQNAQVPEMTNLFAVIQSMSQFDQYFNDVKHYSTAQLQEQGQNDQIIVFRFRLFNQDQLCPQVNIIISPTPQSSQEVQKIAMRLHCFDWNELNEYRRQIATGHMEATEEYSILNNQKVSGRDSWLKQLIVDNRSVYVQQIQSSLEDEGRMLSRMAALRNTKFQYKPTERIGSDPQIFLRDRRYYTVFHEGSAAFYIEDDLIRKYLKLEQPRSKIGFELAEYCEKLSQTQITQTKSADPQIQTLMNLILRNESLIKQIYSRLKESNTILIEAEQQEQAERKKWTEEVVQTMSGYQQADEHSHLARVVETFVQIQHLMAEYQVALQREAYINQTIELQPVGDYKTAHAVINTFIQQQKSGLIKNEFYEPNTANLKRRVDLQGKNTVVLQTKLCEIEELIKNTEKQIIITKEKTNAGRQRFKELQNVSNAIKAPLDLKDIKIAAKQLINFVRQIQLSQKLSGDSKIQFFKLRGIDQIVEEIKQLKVQDDIKREFDLFVRCGKQFTQQFRDLGLQALIDSAARLEVGL